MHNLIPYRKSLDQGQIVDFETTDRHGTISRSLIEADTIATLCDANHPFG